MGLGIVTQGESRDTLHETIRDALHCHYPASGEQRHAEHPKHIRLHHVREEVIES